MLSISRVCSSALFACTLGGMACSTLHLPPMNVLGAKKDEAHKATYNGLAVKSGQLVLTESPDATSYVFFLIPKKFYAFTHVGVLSMEEGEPWVYDVTGELKTVPSKKRLLDNVSGKMHRRRLFDYVAPNLYAEIYDPPAGVDGEKAAAFVRNKYEEGAEFDPYFDFHDHKRLFCSELVSMAIQSAGGPTIGPETSNPNPSIVAGMKWLGVRPGEALPAGRFAEPARYVAALGQFPSRTAAWAYFQGKRELFRRFTMDQDLEFVLSIDGKGKIEVRAEILSFTSAASHLFDRDPNPPDPDDPRIEIEVRKLADERFGAFKAPLPAGESAKELQSREEVELQ